MLLGEEIPVGRPSRWMAVSFVLHLAVAAYLLHRPDAILINPQFIQLGDGLKSYHVVYVPADASAYADEPVERNKLALAARIRKRHAKPNHIKPLEVPRADPQGEVAQRNAHVGVIYGSLWALMEQGHDVKPAIPVEYPSPSLGNSDLPPGYQGDVVIEVTIDRDGSVVDSQLLQKIGHGIDEKCLAAVQHWRFRPAILDGTPIASKHDVHFHFPS